MRHKPPIPLMFITGSALVVLLEAVALAGWQGWLPRKQVMPAPARHARPPAIEIAFEPFPVETSEPDERTVVDAYYRELRARIRWVPARIGREVLMTVDPASRLLLAKSAAQRARLDELGLGFEDVYGIIAAESSWTPRERSTVQFSLRMRRKSPLDSVPSLIRPVTRSRSGENACVRPCVPS